MSSRHFLTIFWRRRTDLAVASEDVSTVTVNKNTIHTIDIEIIIWHIFAKWNRGTTVVTQMEDSGLDTKPIITSVCFGNIQMSRIKTYHRRYRAKATEICLPGISFLTRPIAIGAIVIRFTSCG